MDRQEKVDEASTALKLKLEQLLNCFDGRDSIKLSPYLLMTLNEFVDCVTVFGKNIKGTRHALPYGGHYSMYPVSEAMWGRRRIPISHIINHVNEYIAAFNKTFNMQITPLPDRNKSIGI